MDNLTQMLADVFDRCLADGMKLPFILCAAAVNGSVLAYRFHGPGIAMDELAEHPMPEGMQLPINLMIVDQTGEATQVVITTEGVSFH
jgi:hypothetical protein